MSDSLTEDYLKRRQNFKAKAEGNLNRCEESLVQLGRCFSSPAYANDEREAQSAIEQVDEMVAEFKRIVRRGKGRAKRAWREL